MNETEFEQIAAKELAEISRLFENFDPNDELEVDLLSDVLYITLPNNKQYVINRHRPTCQIWLSSPFSGAGYFKHDSGAWLNKQGLRLRDLLQRELNEKL